MSAPDVRLTPIPFAEKAELRALFDVYLLEHADSVDPQRVNGDPLDYPYFDPYWTEPERQPLWIMAGAARAGFVLISDYAPPDLGVHHHLSEFYVRPEHRRGGGRVPRRRPGATLAGR